MVFPDGTTHTVAVDRAPVSIGRSPKATISIKGESVSRHHCLVTPSRGRLMLLDQGSTNGTKVDGKRVKRARLGHGDTIEVGEVRIRVQASTESHHLLDQRRGGRGSMGGAGQLLLPHEQVLLLRRTMSRAVLSGGSEAAVETVLAGALDAFPADRAMVVTAPDVGSMKVFASRVREGVDVDRLGPFDHTVVDDVLASARAEARLARPAEIGAPLGVSRRKPREPHALCAPARQGGAALGALYLDADSLPQWVEAGEALALLSTLGDLAGLALASVDGQPPRRRERPSSPGGPLEALRETTKLERSEPSEMASSFATSSPVEWSAELGALTLEQQRALVQMGERLTLAVEERAAVIEEQRIELAERLTDLENLQQARSMMSRGLVHDIRNLVSALTANLGVVKLSVSKGSEEADSIDSASQCAHRIISMVEDVLDVSRMEEGTFPLTTEKTSVWNLAQEAVQRFHGYAKDAEVDLVLGEVQKHLIIHADRKVISRVLDNLVSNAIRYAGLHGRVTVEARTTSFATELSVIDTGPGVAPEARSKIFDEFMKEQEERSERHYGIGLYFCRLAVEAHGGAIRVDGESGDNRFVVSLPRYDEPGECTTDTDISVHLKKSGRDDGSSTG